jgi:hypothetical protein
MDYFSNFLKLAPQGKVDQSTIRLLSPDVALHSGVYSFTLNPAEGETKLVQVNITTREMLHRAMSVISISSVPCAASSKTKQYSTQSVIAFYPA